MSEMALEMTCAVGAFVTFMRRTIRTTTHVHRHRHICMKNAATKPQASIAATIYEESDEYKVENNQREVILPLEEPITTW